MVKYVFLFTQIITESSDDLVLNQNLIFVSVSFMLFLVKYL